MSAGVGVGRGGRRGRRGGEEGGGGGEEGRRGGGRGRYLESTTSSGRSGQFKKE